MDERTKYLVIKGSGGGGLGDRVRSVLAGIIYARLSNRAIFVDWSDGMLIPQSRNVFYELFQLNNIRHVQHCPSSDDVFPEVWKDKLQVSLHDQYLASSLGKWDRQAAIDQFSFDQRVLDYRHEVLVMWEFDQLDRFAFHYADGSVNSLMRKIAAEHLAVNSLIADRVREFRRLSYLPGEIVIAVHIRATNEFKKQKNAVSLAQYLSQIRRCIRDCSAQSNQGKFKLFLATDNRDIENQLHEAFPGQLVTREKWFSQPGDRIHFNRHCPDAEKSLQDALIEVCLLAESDYLIYQHNSSFGILADILFKANRKNIYPLMPQITLPARMINRVKRLMQSSP